MSPRRYRTSPRAGIRPPNYGCLAMTIGDRPLFESVVFIIGAGHSISAGGPRIGELTASIVDGDGAVTLDRSRWPTDQVEVLKKTRDELKATGHDPTYEEIFTWLWSNYFASDPTMYRTAWKREDQLKRLDIDPNTGYCALRLIEDGVCQALAPDRLRPEDAPTLALDAAEEARRVTLITLNHDLLLEHLLDQRQIEFSDGFPSDHRTPTWSAATPESRNWRTRVQLIKLHGSIDWWSDQPWGDGGLVYRSRCKPPDAREPRMILTGTGPKLFQASNLMFAQQVLDAGRALAGATCVIAVGYGFRDVRMNSLWQGVTKRASIAKRRLPTVIVDTCPENIQAERERRTRTTPLHETLIDQRSVAYIKRPANETSWSCCRTSIQTLAFG